MTDPIREAIDAINRAIGILDEVPPHSVKLDGFYDRATSELLHAREMLMSHAPNVRKTDPLSRLELATRDLSSAISDDGLPNESERLLLKAITLVREAHRIARIAFEHGYVGAGDREHDTLPPPDEKTEPMAAPFAVAATGALKR